MIHDAILEHLQGVLKAALIDNIAEDDPSRAGVVVLGPLQGDPMDPDVARISVTLHENDPQDMESSAWDDQVADFEDGGIEIGGAVTTERRFTARARCLFENSGEDLQTARRIASTVRSRIEKALLSTTFGGVADDDEYVSRGILSRQLYGRMFQAGGPPDAYDFHINIRFEVLTTKTGV